MTSTQGTKTKALCVATRCADVGQFVATFHRFCDDDTFFVATLTTRPVGLETAFSIQLADKTPVLRGLCVVREAWSSPANPYGRPGIRLGIVRLTRESTEVFERLRARRASTSAGLEVAEPAPTPAPPSIPPIPTSIPPIPAIVTRPIETRPIETRTPAPAARPPPFRPAIPLPRRVGPLAPGAEPEATVASAPEPIPGPEPATTPTAVPTEVPASTELAPPQPEPAPATEPVPPFTPARSEPVPPPPEPSIDAFDGVTALELAPVGSDTVEPDATARPVEVRTPGSELVLPANPLMNLTDESLEGFVDCTLYEETGTFPLDDTTSVGDLDPLIAPPRPLTSIIMPPIEPPLTSPSMALGAALPEAAAEAPQVDAPPPMGPKLDAPVVTEPAYITDAPAYVTDAPPQMGFVSQFTIPVAAPVDFVPLQVAPRAQRTTAGLRAFVIRSRWIVVGAMAVVAVVVVIMLATRSGASAESRSPAAPPERIAPAIRPQPPALADAGQPAIEDPPDPEATASTGPPVVGKGPCRLSVVATPAGAQVQIDGETVGPAPLTIDGPCQRRRVDVAHSRYQTATRWVILDASKPATLDVTLPRPTHAITVVTRPSGATVSIDGRRAGTSPTVVQIMGFQSMSLTVERVGFAPMTRRVYSRAAKDSIVIEMTPLKRR